MRESDVASLFRAEFSTLPDSMGLVHVIHTANNCVLSRLERWGLHVSAFRVVESIVSRYVKRIRNHIYQDAFWRFALVRPPPHADMKPLDVVLWVDGSTRLPISTVAHLILNKADQEYVRWYGSPIYSHNWIRVGPISLDRSHSILSVIRCAMDIG